MINYRCLIAVFMPNATQEMEEEKKLDGRHAIEEAMSMYSFGFV
jgi:hypothetical protein